MPPCQASLPDWAKSCQFCGTDVTKLARPDRTVEKKRYAEFETPQWIWVCYYLIAAWWILGGLYSLAESFYVFGKPLELLKLEKDVGITAGPNIFGALYGGITALFGLGLVLKLEIIRGIVNVIAGIKLAFGLLGLAGSLLGMMFAGALGLIFVLTNIVDVITAGMLIWLIGETDMRANISQDRCSALSFRKALWKLRGADKEILYVA